MRAFLLAAGLGTRLKPLTDTTPKCLVEVCGKPMLHWWVALLEKHGIDTILINTHHLSKQVVDYIIQSDSNMFWDACNETILLGSAGTLRQNKRFVRSEGDFIIVYADVLTDINITEMVAFHRANKSKFTMAVAEVCDTKGKGIVEVKDNVIVSFEEKPRHPKSNLANMGVYVCTPEVLDLIPTKGYEDIGVHLLPQLVGTMLAYKSNDYFCDIGTVDNLKYANDTWNR